LAHKLHKATNEMVLTLWQLLFARGCYKDEYFMSLHYISFMYAVVLVTLNFFTLPMMNCVRFWSKRYRRSGKHVKAEA